MSPRSAELLERARAGLVSARTQVGAGHAATAVSTACYAAETFELAEARELLTSAERFVQAVEQLTAG